MCYESRIVELANITDFIDSLEDDIRQGGLETKPLDLEVARLSLTAVANLLDEYLAEGALAVPTVDRSV